MTHLKRIVPGEDSSRDRRKQKELEKIRRGQAYFVKIIPTAKCFHVKQLIQGFAFKKVADTINKALDWALGGI